MRAGEAAIDEINISVGRTGPCFAGAGSVACC